MTADSGFARATDVAWCGVWHTCVAERRVEDVAACSGDHAVLGDAVCLMRELRVVDSSFGPKYGSRSIPAVVKGRLVVSWPAATATIVSASRLSCTQQLCLLLM